LKINNVVLNISILFFLAFSGLWFQLSRYASFFFILVFTHITNIHVCFAKSKVAHLAVYVRSKVLTTDRIRAHYVSGMQQRSVQADRISSLASGLFQSALEFAPDDHIVLKMYANSLCQVSVCDFVCLCFCVYSCVYHQFD
jgi:hypothetical protein